MNEEQQPEDKSETIEIFRDFQRFQLSGLTGDSSTVGVGFQRLIGGYKLYGADDAEDRWYWKFALEVPTSMLTNGTIVYQWLSYADTNQSNDTTGAVACKVEVGAPNKASADQWSGLVNLDSSSREVVGKKWNKQLREGKMKKPDYEVFFWNTANYAAIPSPRVDDGSLSIQFCETEVVLGDV